MFQMCLFLILPIVCCKGNCDLDKILYNGILCHYMNIYCDGYIF